MKKLLFAYIIVMLLMAVTTYAHATGPKRSYDCKKVGISKVKPYKFKKATKAPAVAVVHPMPKFVASY